MQINSNNRHERTLLSSSGKGGAVFQRQVRDELRLLKRDVTPPGTKGESMEHAPGGQAEAFVEQVRTLLNELEDFVGREGQPVRQIVSSRPLASLASAFTLGVIVAFALRRA